jgi:hypothetical protein
MTSKKSYAELVREVLERFDGDVLPTGSVREHWSNISSSSDIGAPGARLLGSLSRLHGKTDRIALQTRMSLIKSHAQGPNTLPATDRFYLCCRCGDAEMFVFSMKNSSLSELLENMANQFPQFAFKKDSRPSNFCLVLHTVDCPDWHLWDRRRELSTVLEEFETFHIQAMPTMDVVTNQSLLVELLQIDSVIKSKCTEPGVSGAKQEEEKVKAASPSESEWFRKGDRVLYKDEQVAQVVAVHLDDLPHVYYTVRLLVDGKEKQTVHDRLRMHRPTEPLVGGWTVRVTWAGENFEVSGVDPMMSVAAFKEYISHCAPRGSSLTLSPSTKLVCKGADA